MSGSTRGRDDTDALITVWFVALQQHDREIAENWRSAANATRGIKVGVDLLLRKVLRPLFAKGQITVRETDALIVIYEHLSDEDGRSSLESAFKIAHREQRLLKGAESATPTELTHAIEALGQANVGKISFTSPITGFIYKSEQYRTVQNLLSNGAIQVYKISMPQSSALPGFYDATTNSLYINKHNAYSYDFKVSTIVHEMTHAIQDWTDAVMGSFHSEADAFIAQAVCVESTGRWEALRAWLSVDAMASFRQAAKAVIAGLGAPGKTFEDVSWEDLYQNVITKHVAMHTTYVDAEARWRKQVEDYHRQGGAKTRKSRPPNSNVEDGENDIESVIFRANGESPDIRRVIEKFRTVFNTTPAAADKVRQKIQKEHGHK